MLANGVGVDGVESLLLQAALARADGNVASAARMLGMTRPQFAYRIKKRGPARA